MSTIIMNLRGSRLSPIHRGSVLLSKQEYLCSTSYYSSRRKDTSTLRVITLHSEYSCSTSYYVSREELPALRVTATMRSTELVNVPINRFELPTARYRHSEQSRSPRQAYVSVLLFEWEKLPALRVITLQTGRSLLYELLFSELYLAINNSTTSHSSRRKNMATSGEPSTWFPLG